jgi:membrane-bound ClpP family serine protease
MNPYWGSILVALLLAFTLAALKRPGVACMVMTSVLSFWAGGMFTFAGVYMQARGKEAATSELNMSSLVIQIIFAFIFFVAGIVFEGRRAKRMKKLEDENFALKHPKQSTPRSR